MLPDHIHITDDPGKSLTEFLENRKYSKVVVLVDENTEKYCLPMLSRAMESMPVISIPSGEVHKNVSTCEKIWQQLTEHQLDRHAALIILGGGVLGDMGGFCAATYKRGIDFILIPTTLLAQVDASIGGKLGIDFSSFKNHIGVFRQPAFIVLHDGFLASLPHSELRSGFAEVIKHALISDKEVWNEIRSKPLMDQNWKTLLRHSAEFKSSVVDNDPEEKGLRKILNAGHTIGHAIESYFLDTGNPIMHGEAVAAGIVTESWIALKRQMLDKISFNEITACLFGIFPKLSVPTSVYDEIARRCLQDKKNKGNRILCVLPDGIGKAKFDVEISLEEIVESLAFYHSFQT